METESAAPLPPPPPPLPPPAAAASAAAASVVMTTGPARPASATEDAALEAAAYSAKYRKYERDYLRRLNSLYFSGATADSAGQLFESTTTIDDFVIKESKENPLKKFLASSALSSRVSPTTNQGPSETDAKVLSANQKAQRSTPEGNRKSMGRGK
ncbi:hypothetical protein BDL97_10G064800 [Sphagnum fallax]|jgi:hypothetical protein|nr:hypothetical protein BDL97_10G064800 [Sphagnum fallax]